MTQSPVTLIFSLLGNVALLIMVGKLLISIGKMQSDIDALKRAVFGDEPDVPPAPSSRHLAPTTTPVRVLSRAQLLARVTRISERRKQEAANAATNTSSNSHTPS